MTAAKLKGTEAISAQIADMVRTAAKNGTRMPWEADWDKLGETPEAPPSEQDVVLMGPYNGNTGRCYTGVINAWICSTVALGLGLDPNCAWITPARATKKGGVVPPEAELARTQIFFWKINKVYKAPNGATVWNPKLPEIKKRKLKFHNSFPKCIVFRVVPWDLVDWSALPEKRRAPRPCKGRKVSFVHAQHPAVEALPPGAADVHPGLVEAWGNLHDLTGKCTLRIGGDVACYWQHEHAIDMPKVAQFASGATGWGATFLHETVHATMGKLGRDPTRSRFFSRGARAMEELVAEIGAATLCNALGIPSKMRESHAAYVQSWLKALDDDDTAIFTAARMAQEAVDLLLEAKLPKLYTNKADTKGNAA